jgi:hypothetical protein
MFYKPGVVATFAVWYNIADVEIRSQTCGLHSGPPGRAPTGSLAAAVHQHQIILSTLWHITDHLLWKHCFSYYVRNHIWQ